MRHRLAILMLLGIHNLYACKSKNTESTAAGIVTVAEGSVALHLYWNAKGNDEKDWICRSPCPANTSGKVTENAANWEASIIEQCYQPDRIEAAPKPPTTQALAFLQNSGMSMPNRVLVKPATSDLETQLDELFRTTTNGTPSPDDGVVDPLSDGVIDPQAASANTGVAFCQRNFRTKTATVVTKGAEAAPLPSPQVAGSTLEVSCRVDATILVEAKTSESWLGSYIYEKVDRRCGAWSSTKYVEGAIIPEAAREIAAQDICPETGAAAERALEACAEWVRNFRPASDGVRALLGAPKYRSCRCGVIPHDVKSAPYVEYSGKTMVFRDGRWVTN